MAGAARWARTSAAPTHATRSASTGCSASAIASSAAGCPTAGRCPPRPTEDDHVDRGLVFVCFNASISRQFEGIQAQWINDGNVFGLGHDSDFLMGDPNGTGKMTVEGDPPFFLGPQGPFVTTRGGAYLFVPGLAALAALAG